MRAEYATEMAQSQLTTNTAPKFEHLYHSHVKMDVLYALTFCRRTQPP